MPQSAVNTVGSSPKPRSQLIKLQENDMHIPTRKTALKIRCLKEIFPSFICNTPINHPSVHSIIFVQRIKFMVYLVESVILCTIKSF